MRTSQAGDLRSGWCLVISYAAMFEEIVNRPGRWRLSAAGTPDEVAAPVEDSSAV